MTGVITGIGLGLERSSASTLGSAGLLGSASVGQAADEVYVNAATGNLVVQATDQFLMGAGVNDVVSRTYNSLGELSDNNGALWSDAASRQVLESSLTGTVNTAGSTIQRVAADGSVVTYTYNAAQGVYVGNEGGGAYDTLSFNASTNLWTWTDGASQATETYDASEGGRIVSSTDSTGENTESYTYNAAGLLASVTTANGETTSLTYNADNEIASIQTTLQGGAASTQVYYSYDSQGRLTSTTIDLTPGDNSGRGRRCLCHPVRLQRRYQPAVVDHPIGRIPAPDHL